MSDVTRRIGRQPRKSSAHFKVEGCCLFSCNAGEDRVLAAKRKNAAKASKLLREGRMAHRSSPLT